MDGLAGPLHLSRVPTSNVRNRRHDLPGHAKVFDALVSGYLARDKSEAGRERREHPADARARKLSNGLDVDAQAPTGHGAARPGQAAWRDRDG